MDLKTVQLCLSFNYDESFIQVNLDCCEKLGKFLLSIQSFSALILAVLLHQLSWSKKKAWQKVLYRMNLQKGLNQGELKY